MCRNERTTRMLHSALERQSGVQSYVFGDLTENFRRRELCANAAARRLAWFSRSRVTKSEEKNTKVFFLRSHPSDRATTPGNLSYGTPGPAATGFISRKIQLVP